VNIGEMMSRPWRFSSLLLGCLRVWMSWSVCMYVITLAVVWTQNNTDDNDKDGEA